MFIELNSKSRSLGGLSDLTVLAPIKRGLVPSLESITYETRVKRLLQALQLMRESSHEYSIFRAVSDSSERVGRIHSFRVAVIEPTSELLLAVTFDGARESYIRLLHQKIGTLLDLLFCNTEGHVPAYGNSMAAWDAWIESIQVKTDFFYGRPGLTSEDALFLREEEQQRRANVPDADLASVRRAMPSAEAAAWSLAQDRNHIVEAGRQGIQTIVLLHRLSAWFIPSTPDGDFLHRAARDLLPEFAFMAESSEALSEALDQARIRFPEQIDWFLKPYPPRAVPARPVAAPDAALKARIQAGILEPYERVTHGALLLMAFKPGEDPSPFWTLVNEMRTSADAQPGDGSLVCNVAFTYEGLRAAGLSEPELAAFPLEFRAGMEARCSVLGDVRTNHPRRWSLPTRNWTGPRLGDTVELGAVHAVLQLRCGNTPLMAPGERVHDLAASSHPLNPKIKELELKLGPCMELLSRESMARLVVDPQKPDSKVREHFGFADGNGQPVLDPLKAGPVYKDNLVHPGEFVIGEANAADAQAGQGQPEVSPWLRDGSFLVVRKLAQDVKRFNEIVRDGAALAGLAEDTVKAKMMGRGTNGDPLSAPGAGNDFTYRFDAEGRQCPLHAHIRRANPRGEAQQRPPDLPGARPPRIMRRGMSFGPLYDGTDASADKPRGMFFMAYNASIAEQFEVVQRWLAGGNSTGGYSGRSDPFLGVPASGEQRVFHFECPVKAADGSMVDKVHRVALDGDARSEVLPDTMVRLNWGAYLFTPSLAALKDLRDRAATAQERQWPWSADRGRAEIDRLLALGFGEDARDAWKSALEDPDALKTFRGASIWAAIRRDFKGVLRTPYGVLAASHEKAMAVLDDPAGNYSVKGYRELAKPTLGDIYLGLDDVGPGCPYRKNSELPNKAIRELTRDEAFETARRLAHASLQALVTREKEYAAARGEADWQLTFGAKEVWDDVLEGLCREWFGLPDEGDSTLIQPGAFRWDWDPESAVLYAGNFLSPSRYIFQPRPGKEVERVGRLHGKTMNTAFLAWVKELRGNNQVPQKPGGGDAVLARKIFDAFPRPPNGDAEAIEIQDRLVAETLLGALIGFLPTVEGNLRQSLNEWLLDHTFWSLRAVVQTAPESQAQAVDLVPIEAALHRSMQLRPSPEVVWRRATQQHRLGDVVVQADETVVVAIVSATQELLERGVDDIMPIFGGTRGADVGSRPTHACPGYAAATGTLLGIVTALLETTEFLRPTPSPLSFRAEGRMPPPQVTAGAAKSMGTSKTGLRAGAGRVLLVAGDSWFSYWREVDLADLLRSRHGYEVFDEAASLGRTLAWLANREMDNLVNLFTALARRGKTPSAILISAGGNDVVGNVIQSYVLPSPGGLDDAAMKRIMDGPQGVMRMNIRKILDRLLADCRDGQGKPVPVFWQGYDYPIPDGRLVVGDGSITETCLFSVLCQHLRKRGYDTLEKRFAVMKAVVERYGKLLDELSGDAAYEGRFFHANLQGTLSTTLAESAYKEDWGNEMHPRAPGFEKLSDALVTKHLLPKLPMLPVPQA